jgi:hypothetical protein
MYKNFIYFLLCILIPGIYGVEDRLAESPKKTLKGRITWSPYSIVKDAPLIIKGKVTSFSYSETANLGVIPRPEFYRVSIKETIKGTLAYFEIYLIEPPMSDSIDHPPFFLSKNDYILFLKPKDDHQGLISKMGLEVRPIFETVGNWKGAISLGPENPERTNKVLQQEYRLNVVEEESRLVNAIKDFSRYFLESNQEKRKSILNNFIQNQDPLYQHFVNSTTSSQGIKIRK